LQNSKCHFEVIAYRFCRPPFAVFLNENDKNCVDGGIVDESQRSNGKMMENAITYLTFSQE